jgi:hypothetical protein
MAPDDLASLADRFRKLAQTNLFGPNLTLVVPKKEVAALGNQSTDRILEGALALIDELWARLDDANPDDKRIEAEILEIRDDLRYVQKAVAALGSAVQNAMYSNPED